MDVLIAGGGTGGHLFPGIALAQEIRRRDPDSRILFVGSPRGIEVSAVPKAGFDLELLPVSGLRGVGVMGILKGLMRLPVSVVKAFWLVARFRPQLAISCGGYAAGPAVLAARLMGLPCVVLEQNAIPGTTNRILGKLASRIIASLPVEGFAPEKVAVLGNPVRSDLIAIRDVAYAPGSPVELLVFGGSQGARALNEAMMEVAPALVEAGTPLRITHQTGEADCERVRQAYADAGLREVEVLPFIDDMASAYAKADFILCRAGATTIAEVTVCGRPLIMVPFPFAVDDHQTANARAVEAGEAGICLPQGELNASRLFQLLSEMVTEPERLMQMAANCHRMGKPEAVQDITDALEQEVAHV